MPCSAHKVGTFPDGKVPFLIISALHFNRAAQMVPVLICDSRRLDFGYRETFEKMLKERKRGAFSDAAPDGFGGGFGFGFGGYLCC